MKKYLSYRKIHILVPVIFATVVWICGSAWAGYQQVPGLVDLRTTFSDGAYDLDTLTRMAREKGFHLLFINDHDRVAMEYGIPPLRNIFKKRVELNSIHKQGSANYLRSIQEIEKKYSDMIVIAGTESSPFYYWSGDPFRKTLTAHDYEKRILSIGMENPTDYDNIPVLHNDPPIWKIEPSSAGFILLTGALILALLMIRWPGVFRWAGFSMLAAGILFMANFRPAGYSPYDPYHGPQGIAPYQAYIDYVHSRGGMTFWNYPETRSGVRQLGPIRVSTLPYPDVLLESRDYTGFAALYGEEVKATEPGGLWDLSLIEYCKGIRGKPPWAIATSDFHKEGESGSSLGDFQTVFLVQNNTRNEILKAMRQGKMYACRGRYPRVPRLDDFSVFNDVATGVCGDEILISGKPKIRISISGDELADKRAVVRLIRSGKIVKIIECTLPFNMEHEDSEDLRPGEMIYYRMDMKGEGAIVSNPIFVKLK